MVRFGGSGGLKFVFGILIKKFLDQLSEPNFRLPST